MRALRPIRHALGLALALTAPACAEPSADASGPGEADEPAPAPEPEPEPDCKPGTAGCSCLESLPRCDAGCECVGEVCLPDGGGASGNSGGGPSGNPGDDEGAMFVPQPDWASDTWCDPGVQDCPEGEKCTSYVMTPGYCCVDANKCVPIIGDRRFGERCVRGADNDDCAAGLFCLTETSGDTGAGVCITYCDINDQSACADAGHPDSYCIGFSDAIWPHCASDCDPLSQDCPSPHGCYPIGSAGFVCALPNHPKTLGNDGDACSASQSCRPGLFCAPAHAQEGCEADACCTPVCPCDPDQPDGVAAPECTGPELCQCYFDDYTPPGYETLGVCLATG